MSSAKRYSRVAEFDEAGSSVQMDDSRDGGTSSRFGFCLRPSPQMRPGWVPGVVAGLLVVATIILVVVAVVVSHSANQTAPPAAPTPVATPCTTPSPFPVSQIKWHDCPVNTNDGAPIFPVTLAAETIASFKGAFDIELNDNIDVKAECGTLKVPLDWNNSTDSYCSSIEIFVKKVYLTSDPPLAKASKHLWMLPGGAGLPGSVNEPIAAGIVQAMNGSIEVYLVDRRGTGKSDFLGCPLPLSNFGGCIDWAKKPETAKRIRAQTVTNSVKDIIHAMRTVQQGEQEKITTVVMATSQSSYYLHRLLNVIEATPGDELKSLLDAAVYDSVLPSDVTKLPQSEAIANYVGLNLLMRCAQDANCAARFPDSNPIRTLTDLRLEYDNPSNTSCLRKIGLTPVQFASQLGNMLSVPTMNLVPAAIFRLKRCSDNDVRSFRDHWLHETANQPLEERFGISIIAEYINDFSELWFVPGSATTASEGVSKSGCGWLLGVADSALFGTAARAFSAEGCVRKEQAAGAFSYPTDEFYLKYPATKIPLLLMNGDFDPFIAMPWAKHSYTRLLHAGSTKVEFIEVPNSGHTPSMNSPTSYGGNCGLDLALSFAVSPTHTPELACLPKILPHNFDGVREMNLKMFGYSDAWDDIM